MYKVDIYRTENSKYGVIYFIPTKRILDNMTYCYIFEGNMFNYILDYKCGTYMDLDKHICQYISDVYMIDVDDECLTELWHWQDIKNNFKKLLDNEW